MLSLKIKPLSIYSFNKNRVFIKIFNIYFISFTSFLYSFRLSIFIYLFTFILKTLRNFGLLRSVQNFKDFF